MRIQRIGFTAVKGGRHVGYHEVELALTGPAGDRVFCLVDPARDRVLRTVENPSLLRTVSRWHDGVLSVDFPATTVAGVPLGTGSVHEVDYWGRVARVEIVDGPWAAAYSRFLGYEVVLARPVSAGEVVYGASVSIVTTEAMRWPNKADRPPTGAGAVPVDVRHRVRRRRGSHRAGLVGSRAASRTSPPAGALTGAALRGHRPGPAHGPAERRAVQGPGRIGDGGAWVEFGVDAVVTSPGRVRVGDAVDC